MNEISGLVDEVIALVRRVPELLGILVLMVMSLLAGNRAEVKARARVVKARKIVVMKPLLECEVSVKPAVDEMEQE